MAAIQKPTKIGDKYLIENVLNELQKIKKIRKIFIICNDKELRKNLEMIKLNL